MQDTKTPEVMYVHQQGTTPFEIEYFCYQSKWAANLETAIALFQGDSVIQLVPVEDDEIIVLRG